MSGLIWAGIGKGIADAGQTFAGYMAKDIEATRLEEREALREERLLKRQEALDQLKADREEAKAEALRKRVATESVEVEQRAAAAPARRESAALGRDAQALAKSSAQAGEEGDTALSEDQLKGLMQSAPKLRESYAKSGIIGGAIQDKTDPRMRAAEDQAQAALEIGAHSSVIDAYSKKRRDVLDQIRLENSEKKGDQQYEATMAAIAERGRQADQRLPVLQQQADANTTRANRPAGGGAPARADAPDKPATTADLARQVTAAKNLLANELGVPTKDIEGEIKTIRKRADAGNSGAKATLERIQPMISEYNDANNRMLNFKRASTSGAGDGKSTPTKNYSDLWRRPG